MRTRRATLPDAEQIQALISIYSPDGTLLPRSLPEVCENVRDFTVVEHGGRIVGCGALHLYGTHLSEVRSIAVDPEFSGRGVGRRLVRALLREAKHHQVTCVCLFTRIPSFFAKFGFAIAEREKLPDKIYKDCLNCPRQHACDEIAMVRGELPKISVLEPQFAEIRLQILHA